ncbi:hypothetical protein [Marininema halotolerans]|uniref:Uncharacterized protein n=1 Tax=Marininema halotolerans TaxID=1155944 RepID=A0A1I6NWQ2_9BACL|nr:hypothetical protein [Marininema halotolerans]SFS32279.1 hypothetical protein SAMN05444972_101195 [Marininema halotolerans]
MKIIREYFLPQVLLLSALGACFLVNLMLILTVLHDFFGIYVWFIILGEWIGIILLYVWLFAKIIIKKHPNNRKQQLRIIRKSSLLSYIGFPCCLVLWQLLNYLDPDGGSPFHGFIVWAFMGMVMFFLVVIFHEWILRVCVKKMSLKKMTEEGVLS